MRQPRLFTRRSLGLSRGNRHLLSWGWLSGNRSDILLWRGGWNLSNANGRRTIAIVDLHEFGNQVLGVKSDGLAVELHKAASVDGGDNAGEVLVFKAFDDLDHHVRGLCDLGGRQALGFTCRTKGFAKFDHAGSSCWLKMSVCCSEASAVGDSSLSDGAALCPSSAALPLKIARS